MLNVQIYDPCFKVLETLPVVMGWEKENGRFSFVAEVSFEAFTIQHKSNVHYELINGQLHWATGFTKEQKEFLFSRTENEVFEFSNKIYRRCTVEELTQLFGKRVFISYPYFHMMDLYYPKGTWRATTFDGETIVFNTDDMQEIYWEDQLMLIKDKMCMVGSQQVYTGIPDKNGTEICEGDIVITSQGKKLKVIYSRSISPFELQDEETGEISSILYERLKGL